MSVPVRAFPSEVRQPKTLYDDPEASTCPVAPVFRHPVYRWLRPICYVGMPAGMLMASLASFEAVQAITTLYGGFLGAVVGTLVLSQQHARLAALHAYGRRKAAAHRFLCPACFRYGPVRFACGKCEGELEPFVVYTGGLYLNDCAGCRARVFSRGPLSGNHPRALCVHCGASADPLHHRRQVRVLGTLSAEDLDTLRAAGGAACRDDGGTLTYLADLSGWVAETDALPPGHAGQAPDALWIGSGWKDPLHLAHCLDRVITRAPLSEGRRRSLICSVAAADASPHARDLLETRFGCIRYGVSTTAFLVASS